MFTCFDSRLQAKEAAKEYIEAARAYERARDMDSVVRLLLENLNKPEKAAEVVRATRSSEVRVFAIVFTMCISSSRFIMVWLCICQGALLIARYCLKSSDFRGAIEFFLIARRSDDAFQVCLLHCHCWDSAVSLNAVPLC